jgi:predicted GNAT family acetyltransferase
MDVVVRRTEDAARVLADAGVFLASDPVRHNVILTLLHARVAYPEPGRYWIVDIDGSTAGVVFQSPLHFHAAVTPMPSAAVTAAVEAIVGQGVALPGVAGEAATAARFAGHWVEQANVGARPGQGQRIYEVDVVVDPRPTTGRLRAARADEHARLVAWFQAFQADIGDTVTDANSIVRQRLAAGHLWLWADGAPVALAGVFDAALGVARLGPVYTPPDHRNHGYASALVAALSRMVLEQGQRCILYTDLDNPTSNAIYRAMGYEAVAEVTRYSFDP